jgi:DNA-binding SARP family transcriptional activator
MKRQRSLSRPAARKAPLLQIELLGEPRVSVGRTPLRRLRSRKGIELLALLCLHHDREVERSRVAGTLWPDVAEERAGESLRASLHDLRRALGSTGQRIRSIGRTHLCFDTRGVKIDVVDFDRGIRGRAREVERALALHAGVLLQGYDAEWMAPERGARAHAVASALEKLGVECAERGEYEEAVAYLERLVEVEPLRETAQRALMRAYASLGRYADAVRTYQTLREGLDEGSKMSPSPETTELYRELRASARRTAAGVERLLAPPGGSRPERMEPQKTLVLVGLARLGTHEVPIQLALQVPQSLPRGELIIESCRPISGGR